MSLQLLTIIIQACSVGNSNTAAWMVEVQQQRCQAKLVKCFQEESKEWDKAVAKCVGISK